jgi:hypothetical protein
VASGTLNSACQAGSVIDVAVYGSSLARGGLSSSFHLVLCISAGLVLTAITIALLFNTGRG